MSKLTDAFKNQKAFIPFVAANDPDFEGTVNNVVALAKGGADIVELGIPFSDPIADGPVIQAADLRALKADPDLPMDTIFDMVKEIRKQTDVPLAFLTYLNIVFQYGYEAFTARCEELGIYGLVIPDMPLEERGELAPIAEKHNVDLIPLVTPISADRIEKIAAAATGFIYVVSSLGVTGERSEFANGLADLVNRIRKVTDVPTAIGFGIHTPEQATEMAQIADGAIVGSACVNIVAEYGRQAPAKLTDYTKQMKAAVNANPVR
ncbi:tryptophan synthase alpha chain [Secundilactobacillus silagincola]|uniref:Tryptophan synthase alpha chain n=1 Tax=Secundilactobacillus silagincola TaxID=1714681 RepID=A0A1Z5J279_9LACO|nr:tryptophan synthase subunit alpha [Secundilactobacillus silagincola]GAX08154.1 tryptophan synthase alpha chain [Secundilactobacillus silagincola]